MHISITIEITNICYRLAKLSAKKVQFVSAKKYAMAKNIREVLSPVLIISYVCGLRVVNFPTGDPRQWFHLLYMLLLWLLYIFIIIYKITYTYTYNFSIEYHVCTGLHIFTVILSIVIGVYYNKIFRNCIKKLTIVDDTLEKLGTRMDYHKLKIRITWLALGWSLIILLITCSESYHFKEINFDILAAIFTCLLRNYCIYIQFIGDLIIVIILGYAGLKFDQINQHLGKLAKDSKHELMLAWEHPMLCLYQSRFSKTSKNKSVMWIIMHLHSELCKISREMDSIFGIQMTLEMGCCFAYITLCSREIFNIIFIKNYMNDQILYVTQMLFWFFLYVFRVLLINYVCERVSNKAGATRDFINRLSYPNCNVEINENILQFLLQIFQSPLKFYGFGLFQFGFKFLYGFSATISTVLIIYIQAHINNKHLRNND